MTTSRILVIAVEDDFDNSWRAILASTIRTSSRTLFLNHFHHVHTTRFRLVVQYLEPCKTHRYVGIGLSNFAVNEEEKQLDVKTSDRNWGSSYISARHFIPRYKKSRHTKTGINRRLFASQWRLLRPHHSLPLTFSHYASSENVVRTRLCITKRAKNTMASAVTDLEAGLQAMLNLKPPGVSGSRITSLTSLCVSNIQVITIPSILSYPV